MTYIVFTVDGGDIRSAGRDLDRIRRGKLAREVGRRLINRCVGGDTPAIEADTDPSDGAGADDDDCESGEIDVDGPVAEADDEPASNPTKLQRTSAVTRDGRTVTETIACGQPLQMDATYQYERYKLLILPLEFRRLDRLPASLRSPDEGVAWLLKVSVTNFRRHAHESYIVREIVRVVDQDGFCYSPITDNDFISESNFAKENGLARLSSLSETPKLQPKLPAKAGLLFIPPAEPGATYTLGCQSDDEDDE